MICTETEIEKVLPGEVGDTDPSSPVDESENGQDGQTQPPEPQDEEVLLVEQVVAENAEEVGPVQGSGQRAHIDVTRDLGGEQLAHGVMHRVGAAVVGDVLDHLHAVVHEVVVEDPVSDAH